LSPVSHQVLLASMVSCSKFTKPEPKSAMVPAAVLVPCASSSVLCAVAPMVLPPSTLPVSTAPGSTAMRLVKPASNCTASPMPAEAMVPVSVTVPPARSRTPVPTERTVPETVTVALTRASRPGAGVATLIAPVT
jgi:hypothetical protein